jgi:hypothetical protein
MKLWTFWCREICNINLCSPEKREINKVSSTNAITAQGKTHVGQSSHLGEDTDIEKQKGKTSIISGTDSWRGEQL